MDNNASKKLDELYRQVLAEEITLEEFAVGIRELTNIPANELLAAANTMLDWMLDRMHEQAGLVEK